MKRNYLTGLSRNIEHNKNQGTIYNGHYDIQAITLELIEAFFNDLRGCWRQFFSKKGSFSHWKDFGLIFPVLSNMEKKQETIF